MSYEHCDQHDQDATNGCPDCEREEQRQTLFAFCEHCNTLFTNGLGQRFEHFCRTRTRDGLREKLVVLEWTLAARVDDLSKRTWYPAGRK